MKRKAQDRHGRYLRHCGWCGVPCYGKACRDHRVLDDRLREHYEGRPLTVLGSLPPVVTHG